MIILFDLDGTLTDPAVGITRSLQHALAALGRIAPPAAALTRFIGPPLRASFAELLETTDSSLIADAVSAYREPFATGGLFEDAVYAGVPEVLDAARAAGHRTFVLTSKPHVYARRIVITSGCHLGSRTYSARSSRARTRTRATSSASPSIGCAIGERAWMVGDRGTDTVGARVNDIGAIAAAWWYGREAELRAAGPDLVFATPIELRAFVTTPEPR